MRGAETDPLADAFARFQTRIGITALALSFASAVYAAVELRPLFGDGAYFLLRILETESWIFPAPARMTVEGLRSVPTLGAIALGASALETLALVFSLTYQLAPLLLTASAWAVLPRGRRAFAIFPLLHYFAGTISSDIAAHTEGPFAAAYFWLLFHSVLFRANTWRSAAAIALLAGGALRLHEALLFLAPMVGLAAAWRGREAETRFQRLYFAGLTVWFAVVSVFALAYVVRPSHPANSETFFAAFLGFEWLWGAAGVNLPAILGGAGLGILGAVGLLQLRNLPLLRRTAWAVIALFAAAAIAAMAWAWWAGRMDGAFAQFHARNNALLISFPLATMALYFATRSSSLPWTLMRQAVVVCGVLAGAGTAWQIHATYRWALFTDTVRALMRERRGFVTFESALAALPRERQLVMWQMSQHWALPSLSIMLSPSGSVSTLLWGPRQVWQPFDPRKPEQVPRSRFWTIEPYLRALAEEARGRR